MTSTTSSTTYPYVVEVKRRGEAVHLGFSSQPEAEHASVSLAEDLEDRRDTAHADIEEISWSPTLEGMSVLEPVPTDACAIAELILEEQKRYPTGPAPFPDLSSRLKAQVGQSKARGLWEEARLWLDRDAEAAEATPAPTSPTAGSDHGLQPGDRVFRVTTQELGTVSPVADPAAAPGTVPVEFDDRRDTVEQVSAHVLETIIPMRVDLRFCPIGAGGQEFGMPVRGIVLVPAEALPELLDARDLQRAVRQALRAQLKLYGPANTNDVGAQDADVMEAGR